VSIEGDGPYRLGIEPAGGIESVKLHVAKGEGPINKLEWMSKDFPSNSGTEFVVPARARAWFVTVTTKAFGTVSSPVRIAP